jgi:CTP synthase (UTP-ammonia lyase)
MTTRRIGLIGDYNPDVLAHQAIPRALALAGAAAGCVVEPVWIGTPEIAPDPAAQLGAFAGLWCVPASPYASMDGALRAIRFAREAGVPFLGTCGGFQHALIEYARTVLGLAEAAHAETDPDASTLFITPLQCALRGVKGAIHFRPGTRIRAIYGQDTAIEEYNCGFGLNPAYRAQLETGPLRITAVDDKDSPRVVELADHPFYLATLYQPERSAFAGQAHPLITAYLSAVCQPRS